MNDTIHIFGGKPLTGSVKISGSKNGSLPTLAACLLMEGESRLTNIPQIEDVEVMLELLRCCGAKVTRENDGAVTVNADNLRADNIPRELACKMRASYYVLGPLAARIGHGRNPMPGGCNLGDRPVDYILDALTPLGLAARVEDDYLIVENGPAKGGRVVLNPLYRSTAATFLTVMVACLSEGETIIENACAEPDLVNFCEFLTAAGAKLEGFGSEVIRVQGVKRLIGVEHEVLCDRLEAGTYLLAGAATRGDLTALGVKKTNLRGFYEKLEESGVEVLDEAAGLRVICSQRPRAVDIVTHPSPGFPTDLQPPTMAFLACADGVSHIEEKIFNGRMGHVDELRKMGANIETDGKKASIYGLPSLKGAEVEALNIRAGATLIVAAVAAEGQTTINGISHIRRGYECIEAKLADIGVEIS